MTTAKTARSKDTTSQWRNRIVGYGEEAPDQLVANPRNWRVHPKAQQDALAGVLDEVGWVQTVIVNRRTGFVVDGHLRVGLAISREERAIPVAYVDLSEEEEALVLATLDPIAGMAAAAKDQLEALLRDVGRREGEVGALLQQLAAEAGLEQRGQVPDDPGADFDHAEELRAKWGVERGQVWLCGSHRIMCGDSADSGDVARLMAGQTASLMVTDPPYGVGYQTDGKNPRGRKDKRPLANDDLGDHQEAFWTAAFSLWPLQGDAYIFSPPGPLIVVLCASLEAAGITHHQWLIWVKHQFVLGRSHYHYRHEHIFYGWKGKTSWNGSRAQDSVWEAERPMASPEHPTMKPVSLCQRAIENSSRASDLVIDPFLGSGTTLVAAERLGRRCYGMEIDPIYVAVALERIAGMGIEPRLEA